MWNASEFMKTLKQHFTMSYNGRRTHAGTMWEGRYHVRVHKPDSLGEAGAVMMTAAYIDLNPVKAGIVSGIDALADYEWVESGNNQLTHNLLKLIAKNGPMRPVELRDALGIASRAYFTLKYLSPLVAGGYIAPVDKDNPSSSRRAYKLTRRGEEAAQW